ncbi:polysaccharide deacetylase family protein [Silvanigrella aquatica]|uniref:NodB homology domain-containing protein n=1 Tax=Silvanigrella aquatica TaxID=1915309 RepID=A0A1L4D321_9BACT|nr:polysaccharide deacetylase family protein [Silvanigrella aquatica]APJ04587.1 hypothetical protein AXG55_11990 [Silvanigrella aquatica]
MKIFVKNTISIIYNNLLKLFPLKGARLLMYHSFDSKLSHDRYGISMDFKIFCEQILFLKRLNYIFVPLSSIYENLKSDKVIIMTFDDGYKDNIKAAEFLKLHNIPFTVFITSDFVNKFMYLSKSDIKFLSKFSNCTIGAHGKTHSMLAKLSYAEQQYELEYCKSSLEEISSLEINQISYPHGSFNHDTIEICKNLGFKFAASSLHGLNTTSNFNAYSLKRTEIIASDNLKIFTRKITGGFDFMKYKDSI